MIQGKRLLLLYNAPAMPIDCYTAAAMDCYTADAGWCYAGNVQALFTHALLLHANVTPQVPSATAATIASV